MNNGGRSTPAKRAPLPDQPTLALPAEGHAAETRAESEPGEAVLGGGLASLRQDFDILDELGRGASGVVYRARDRRLGREVAVKLLRDRADPATLERFRREGEITASLEHPGIVRVHSAADAGGYPYLVYELIPGARTLREQLPAWPLPERMARLAELADAVGVAHARGVVHRDLKPANVLVDAEDRVRVADFGLALDPNRARLTLSGLSVGTPLYMAPEQVQARRAEVSPATDTWALGVILYEALTDQSPFIAATPIEVFQRILGDDPRPPRRLAPEVSPALEAVCLRALARDPAARFADGAAFAAALRAALRGEGPPRRAWPGWATLALGACGLAVAGLIASGLGEGTPRPLPASPGPTPLPSRSAAVPSPPHEAASAAAERLGFLEDPRRQAREAAAWLARHPRPPLADEVRAVEASARRAFPVHTLPVVHPTAVAFLPRGERAVVCGTEGALLWDLAGGAVLRRWLTDQALWGLAVAPDGERILVGGDGAAWLLTLDGRAEPVRHRFQGPVSAAGFGGNGNVFALGGLSPTVDLFGSAGGLLLTGLGTHRSPVRGLVITPDERYLVSACGSGGNDGMDRSVRFFRLSDGALCVRVLTLGRVSFVCGHPDGGSVIVGGSTGDLLRFRVPDGQVLAHFGQGLAQDRVHTHPSSAHAGAIDARREQFYVLEHGYDYPGRRYQVRRWDLRSGRQLGHGLGRSTKLGDLALDPSGEHLLVTDTERQQVELWLAEAVGESP